MQFNELKVKKGEADIKSASALFFLFCTARINEQQV